ncbi:MAG: HEAT repeat domain-containing protein [Phycisphaerae bacterium]
MTWSLMGKLFGVPLVIIGVIVGAAVVVVLTFGAPAATQQRSLDELLQALESSTGRRSAGMLLPRDKEHWQAGLELTRRLETKDREFSDSELTAVASRVGGMIRKELAGLRRADGAAEPASGSLPGRSAQRRGIAAYNTNLDFLIRALGLTEHPWAIDVLVEVVRSAPDRYRAAAMQQLGNLAHMPGSSAAVEPILQTLTETSSVETQLVACTVLSVLADPSDSRVIDALASVRLATAEGEVAWSAALALARLGSNAGKSTLADLLDRSFWEADDRYERTDDAGHVFRYRMPAHRVDAALFAAIDAAANLDDADLWDMIRVLTSDVSPVVRQRAVKAVTQRGDRALQ